MNAEYSVEEVRARFESAFARKEELNLFRLDGEYSSTPTRWAFAAYQAAYAERIEVDEGAVPEGMALVPREPTDAMFEAALALQGEDAALARSPALLSALLKIYLAMLAAAPSQGAGTL